jgi:predicted DNA-binding ArsR family transcriptional regulator
MNVLLGEVIKVMGNETTTTGEITDKLNRSGWGVRGNDVLDALHRLEVQGVVERLWRRKQHEAKPDVEVKKAASGRE